MLMKKYFILCLLTLMSLTASAGTTDDLSVLRCDSMKIRGNMITMMNQQVIINAFNESPTDDYTARWYLQLIHNNQKSIIMDTLVYIPSLESRQLDFKIALPEGFCYVYLSPDKEGWHILGESFCDIQPLRQLHIDGSLSLQMLSNENGTTTLYGNHLQGSVTLENTEKYFGCSTHDGSEDGLWLWLDDTDEGQCIYTQKLGSELEFESLIAKFDFTADLRNNGSYALRAGYMAPNGLVPVISKTFTAQLSAISYWTVSEQAFALTADASGVLALPADATAVDLRGLDSAGNSLTIDDTHANPNCLIYLQSAEQLPAGLSTIQNIIINGEAENIRVNEDYDYFCPMTFKAKYISYVMRPSYQPSDEQLQAMGYSETLVLPFNVGHGCLYDVNDEPQTLHADMLKILEYQGNIGDSLNVSPIHNIYEMKAYQPYILGAYINSRLLFFAENTEVPVTREAVSRGSSLNLVGTTVAVELDSTSYQYNPADSRFHRNYARRVPPFHAYITSNGTEPVQLSDIVGFTDYAWGDKGRPGSEQTTFIPQHRNALHTSSIAVYTLQGQHIMNIPAAHHGDGLSSLPRGLYIINHQKISVK